MSEFLWLKPNDITIDPEVQRQLDNRHASRLAKEYDANLFGLRHLSLRTDGKYVVLDAQHRCAAAGIAGQGHVAVLFKVYRGLTTAQEASLFCKLNANKKSVAALDNFRLAVTAGHPVYCDITRIVESFGLCVSASKREGGVGAVHALINLYDGKVGVKANAHHNGLPRGQLLSRTLHVLVTAWNRHRDSFESTLLRGVASMLYKHGAAIDAQRLARALAKSGTPLSVISAIRGLQQLSRKSMNTSALEHLESIYNRRPGRGERL